MTIIKITKDGTSNTIVANFDFAQQAYPIEDGYTHEDVTPASSIPPPVGIAETFPKEMREWRDRELKTSDWIVPLSDHPQRAAYMSYRTALRDWPATGDFPDTKPELGS